MTVALKAGCENVWRVDVHHNGERIQRQYTGLKEDAEALEASLLVELVAKTEANRPWTLDTAIERVIEAVWKHQSGARTTILNAKAVKDFFGPKTRLDHITTDQIDEFREHLREEHQNSNATINRKLAALSKVLQFAAQRGKLATIPYIQREEEAEGRIRWLTLEEEVELLRLAETWGKLDHRGYFLWSIDTGMRPSESFRVQRDHIDLKTRMVHIWKSKARTARSIPLTPRVVEVVRERLKAWQPGQQSLWPYTLPWVRDVWNRAKHHMGLKDDPYFIPYIMRHTFASRLLQAGIAIPVIQGLMGHSLITTTMRYAHLAPSNYTAAIAALSPVVATPEPNIRIASQSVNQGCEVDVG